MQIIKSEERLQEIKEELPVKAKAAIYCSSSRKIYKYLIIIKVMNAKFEQITELAGKRGFFYPSAEIYGGKAGFWDYGPNGQALRRKIVNIWRHELVQKENMLEIYGSQILPACVFEGSGHLKCFADPVVACLKCKRYERADKLISESKGKEVPEGLDIKKLDEIIKKNKIRCPNCKGELSRVSRFNMMVETLVGMNNEDKTFLRPETCQSIFLNFPRLVKTMRMKLPQGIAQEGRAFRNEISPRQGIIRTIEFSQFEAEVFFNPKKINLVENFDEVKDYKIRIMREGKNKIEEFTAQEIVDKKIVHGRLIAYYLARTQQVWNKMGIPLEKMRFREVGKDEKAFYALATFDFEVETCLGWLELIANNYRGDYDLKNHMEHSKTNLEYMGEAGERIIPHIWEISSGVDRTLFAVLDTALKEGKEGLYFALKPNVAPYACAILPLVNKEQLPRIAKMIEKNLKGRWFGVYFDDTGSIGRRYARQDEIGTPYCITVDFQSQNDNTVTLRDRDSTKQARIKIDKLQEILYGLISETLKFEELGPLV
ncbi:glycine--tRNA ligase [archaeon]|nr:glycine--tRNA ligase [archaeon]